jgi:hypothetical protein
MLAMVKLALPVLFRVRAGAAVAVPTLLVMVRLVGVTAAKGALPVPVRLTAWGLPGALSVMVTEAERDPKAVGAKVTLIVQVPFAATALPQVLV